MKPHKFTILLFVLFSCSTKSDITDDIFFMSKYEAIDIGSPYKNVIFYGRKEDGITIYDKTLVYPSVIAFKRRGKSLYVKQRYDKNITKEIIEVSPSPEDSTIISLKDNEIYYYKIDLDTKRVERINKNECPPLEACSEKW
ncbi:hypothetical protein EDL99_07285 [Ornithobacterium rhinotracheale]|uniref:hypothetical protein n=1 Tax=Ornithobacterium rhinotracheale TaxID=28251 RepID=UPI00129C28D1|nr:hypothetical protein [Ornithobacterium rhinotracheale]MRJ08669.1 hypothetical protein [Ornithobacterium rhinotracheale]UOH76885.1 hypothetical protein MT996_06550 [Ornithobacterium rhinotracheale]